MMETILTLIAIPHFTDQALATEHQGAHEVLCLNQTNDLCPVGGAQIALSFTQDDILQIETGRKGEVPLCLSYVLGAKAASFEFFWPSAQPEVIGERSYPCATQKLFKIQQNPQGFYNISWVKNQPIVKTLCPVSAESLNFMAHSFVGALTSYQQRLKGAQYQKANKEEESRNAGYVPLSKRLKTL